MKKQHERSIIKHANHLARDVQLQEPRWALTTLRASALCILLFKGERVISVPVTLEGVEPSLEENFPWLPGQREHERTRRWRERETIMKMRRTPMWEWVGRKITWNIDLETGDLPRAFKYDQVQLIHPETEEPVYNARLNGPVHVFPDVAALRFGDQYGYQGFSLMAAVAPRLPQVPAPPAPVDFH